MVLPTPVAYPGFCFGGGVGQATGENFFLNGDFFRGGGKPRPLKGYHAPPAGGPGAKAPRTVAKFHFSNDGKY